MRALLMGPEEQSALAKLRELAEGHVSSIRRTIMVPMGFCVTFSVDQRADGAYRHLSVSVDGKRGMVPNEFAMAWIAEQLGFTKKMKEIYLENETSPHPTVNWLQKC